MDFSDPKAVTVWLARAIAYVTYAYIVLCEILLLQGFLLRLFGADPTAEYTQWAYRSLDRVMSPFRGIFEPVELNGDAVLDTSILFAMVIYGIVALLLRMLLDWLTYRLHKIERDRAIEEAQSQAAIAKAGAPYAATVPPATQEAPTPTQTVPTTTEPAAPPAQDSPYIPPPTT